MKRTKSIACFGVMAVVCAGAAGLTGCAGGGQSKGTVVAPPAMSSRAGAFARAREIAMQAQLQQDPAEAIRLYHEAVTVYRDLPAAWNNLGLLLLEAEQYLEAANAFVVASEQAPTDPRAVYNLGLTWERTRRLDEALRHYKRALERDPRHVPSLRGAVYAERRLGEAEEKTLERIYTALLLEENTVWRGYFERQQLEVKGELRAKAERP